MSTVISNPVDREKLLKLVKDCSDAMTRMDGEKDFVKETIEAASKNFQISKKLVAKLIKVYYKQNFQEEMYAHTEFETLYQTVVK